jgi:Carboxypeptidase regulatory-like domain
MWSTPLQGNRMQARGFVWAVLLFIVFLCTSGWPQSSTSSLRGTVSDASGAVVPGATVRITDPQNGSSRTTNTDGNGLFQFLQLSPSTYSIEVSASGFSTVKEDNIRLLVSTPATVHFTLRVRSTSEKIEVTGEAPLVNTDDAALGHAFGTEQIESLPMEGRDPTAILSLQPGVAFVGNNPSINQDYDSRSGAVNGARSDQSNITIDGIDNNDPVNGYAFQGALRATLDSLQEFKVTTTNANADAGRSSGAQVALVTKSGTNHFHGSLYEFYRPTFATANDWFNKHAELESGLPNVPGTLQRNTFGASIGGPIKKDRLFFFATYEGNRTREDTQISRSVPTASLRKGLITYISCPTAPNCQPGASNDFTVTLTPAQIATMDPKCQGLGTCPLGRGVDPAILALVQSYPLPNTTGSGLGDGINVSGFTFAGPAPGNLSTYIVKLDYELTSSQHLFVRGNLQADSVAGTNSDGPQFPGDPPNITNTNNSKGIAAGYTVVLRNNLVNNFHYGYIRESTAVAGLNYQAYVSPGELDTPTGLAPSSTVALPLNNFVDDVSWIKGRHTLQFGGNARIINDLSTSNQHSFNQAAIDVSYLLTGGFANKGTSFDPAKFGFPPVALFFESDYDQAMGVLSGIIPAIYGNYNRIKTGEVLPEGTPVSRHYRAYEAEFYLQDVWHAKPNLTLTGGVRYTLLQPPYEANGNQVATNMRLSEFFANRQTAMLAGETYNPTLSYQLSGQANGGRPYWDWDYKDIAPRVAFAWSPHRDSGWLRSLLGESGQSSIRGGYGIYYDHFGEGVIRSFDEEGAFGLTTTNVVPVGEFTPDTAPRFTGLYNIPTSFVPPPPTGNFPLTPPNNFNAGGFVISAGMDDKMKTPYSQVIDFSLTRELPRQFVLEASYVGRLGRRLLQLEDFAMPLDVRDPKSGTDYFSAATQFSLMARARTPINDVRPIPYWQNLFPTAAGPGKLSYCAPGTAPANPSATQNLYDLFTCYIYNEIEALFVADLFCSPGCATLNGVTQPYQYFDGQWSSLYAWRSIGNSSFNAGQFTLRHRTGDLQFDLNYTLSKSIDIASNAERIRRAYSFAGEIINAWSPNQGRGLSDFDATHQINANWIYDLPVGQGKRFGSTLGGIANGFLGNWEFTGIARWANGFPYSISNGFNYPTNWDLPGLATLTGKLPPTGTFIDENGAPNMFPNKNQALAQYSLTLPGQSGNRNQLRGPGFFGIDAGLGKSWKLRESQALQFRWETFNVTNSVRFGFAAVGPAEDSLPAITSEATFGEFTQTLTKPRVMQFSLRYSF